MPDIHHSISIAAPAETVFRLVSTGEGLRQWWADDVEAAAGGVVTLGFFGRTTIYRLRPLEINAGRVAWRCETGKEWEGTDLVFTITSDRAGVVLDFVHAKWQGETPYFVSCNTTWGGLMFRLRSAAEGQRPGPLFLRGSLGY